MAEFEKANSRKMTILERIRSFLIVVLLRIDYDMPTIYKDTKKGFVYKILKTKDGDGE